MARRRTSTRRQSCGPEPLEPRRLLAGWPIKSEFLADNAGGLTDAQGRTSDWIEILNAGDEPIDLAGWHLTDDVASPTKWTIPSHVLAAGEYLLVFASGDGLPDAAGNLHANFDLAAAGEYLALVQPDGATIASEFAPAYPPQHADVAYGIAHEVTQIPLLGNGSTARWLVPTAADDAQLGSGWTGGQPLDDATWQGVALPIGFDDPPQPLPSLATVALQQATADFSQLDFGLTVADVINGIQGGGDDGWGLYSVSRGRAAAGPAPGRW